MFYSIKNALQNNNLSYSKKSLHTQYRTYCNILPALYDDLTSGPLAVYANPNSFPIFSQCLNFSGVTYSFTWKKYVIIKVSDQDQVVCREFLFPSYEVGFYNFKQRWHIGFPIYRISVNIGNFLNIGYRIGWKFET